MEITYIGHSGFLVELEKIYLLFDYYEGEIPPLDQDKQLYVFVSHKHADHYNFQIWELRKQYSGVKYILSKDVPFTENVRKRRGLEEGILDVTLRVHGNNTYQLDELVITTLKSTDEGVAYLVKAEGRNIYHAGDLNLWAWKGESEAYNTKMRRNYCGQIDRIKDVPVDVAFLPLDSRQGEYAYDGIDYFRKQVPVKQIFPMHFWGKFELTAAYLKDRRGEAGMEGYHVITREGQTFLPVLK